MCIKWGGGYYKKSLIYLLMAKKKSYQLSPIALLEYLFNLLTD